MNAAKIIAMETSDQETFHVTLQIPAGMSVEDFDLNQLGGAGEEWEEPASIFGANDWDNGTATLTASGVKLKIGDSITDEKGGEPVVGEARNDASAYVDPRHQWAVKANEEARADFADKHRDRR